MIFQRFQLNKNIFPISYLRKSKSLLFLGVNHKCETHDLEFYLNTPKKSKIKSLVVI